MNTTLSFWIITLVYVILGLMEVEDAERKLQAFLSPPTAHALAGAAADTARKFRKYMEVRTLMSLATGALVWAFAAATGLQFAVEWGVIAFALNYIPFIGPFIATVFPTLLAMAQFATWQAALGVFVCLNIIQFVIGSYVEPRVSGNVLAISPSVVLFSVFFWTFLWGLYGAFIGVPIAIAALTFCEHFALDPMDRRPARRPAAPRESGGVSTSHQAGQRRATSSRTGVSTSGGAFADVGERDCEPCGVTRFQLFEVRERGGDGEGLAELGEVARERGPDRRVVAARLRPRRDRLDRPRDGARPPHRCAGRTRGRRSRCRRAARPLALARFAIASSRVANALGAA